MRQRAGLDGACAAGSSLWQPASGKAQRGVQASQLAVDPVFFGAYTLDREGMAALLATAPREASRGRSADALASSSALTLALPDPCGQFVSFAVQEAPIMEPGLAEKHPDIKTYRGRGIDDPAATIRFDLTPLGFHASVRSPGGAWYLEPYYHLDQSVYASYFGSDLPRDADDSWVERDADAADLTLDQREKHPDAAVTLSGSGFAANSTVTITISDPEENFTKREVIATADELGMFTAEFVADPNGDADTHLVTATDGSAVAYSSYQVGPAAAPSAIYVATGDVLRVYRLALITDPGYATYWGGSANVTPAKVTLINRVNQLYEDDMSIRMVLVANNDLLNLDTWGQATGPNGPCGAAACFTQSQVTGCSSTSRARYVIGQIIGASNYDIGHLGLGQPGGGVANLGVVGRSNKAGGCTGIPTPNGDYYAVDYVAHEMGHQFSGNHPFNGNQLNCSGGNRSAANSVEPGSGSSVMAYAGICLTDDLQAHSDPYFSQRSQQEISSYTASSQSAINEVQTVSLRRFGGGNEVQTVTFGPGYSQAATVQPLSLTINAAPSAASVGGATEDGNVVTIAVSAAHTLQPGDVVTIAGVGVAGYNGTWTVDTIPTSRSFTFTNPTAGLARSGGGTVTLAVPGATESGTTVTISTAAPHGRAVGDVVTIASVGVAGYNGTFAITAVPTARSFQYTAASSGLAASGGGTATYYVPFQVRIGGNDSAVIGGSGLAYQRDQHPECHQRNRGLCRLRYRGQRSFDRLRGHVRRRIGQHRRAEHRAGQPELRRLLRLGRGNDTRRRFDSFKLDYNGNVSPLFTNGSSYSPVWIQAVLQGSELQTVSLTGFDTNGDVYTLNYDGADSVADHHAARTIPAQASRRRCRVGTNSRQSPSPTSMPAPPAIRSGFRSAATSQPCLATAERPSATPTLLPQSTPSPDSPAQSPCQVRATAASRSRLALRLRTSTWRRSGSCSARALRPARLAPRPVARTSRARLAVAGWPTGGTVTVDALADTGYTLSFGGTLLNMDVSQADVTNASGCSGTSVEALKGAAGLLPSGATVTVSGFGGGTFNGNGFQVTFSGTLASTDVPVMLALQDFSAGTSGWVGETDKGGAVDNTGGPLTVTSTGNTAPVVTAPAQYTIPLRTPFSLTGSATDAENDPLIYSWEQNDRGGSAGTSLLNNTKTDGPLFAMFPKSGIISTADSLQYNSPGQNHLTTNPTRVFPDLQQILDNNTNADTGACRQGPIAPYADYPVRECYAEFLPTSAYVGFSGVNASPLALHMRFTARDGNGGSNYADTTLLLAAGTGPFLVTAPNVAGPYAAPSVLTVTWNPAGTDVAPVGASNVKISLSTDGGQTYPYVLAASTANDGSEAVTLPSVNTTQARVKIEALGNIFFDVSNANFTLVVPSDVYVNATWTGSAAGAEVAPGKFFGVNAFATLQAALDAVLEGGTVNVAEGTYAGGNIVTKNGVTIYLNNATVGHGSPAFTINADDVVLQGPGTLNGGGTADPAVLVNAGADNFTLRDTSVMGWQDGLELAGSVVSLKVFGNYIHDNSRDGLHVDAGAGIGGVINIDGNLFKANGGAGVNNAGPNTNLNAQYNSWGDLAGPTGPQGDGVAGSVDASNFTFVEPFMDMVPDTLAATRTILQSQSFDAKLKVDAAKLYGLTFKVTYDPAYLTLNSTTFVAPWDGHCTALSVAAGVMSYRCQLLAPAAQQDVVGATVATFNFTALPGSGAGPWTTYLDISALPADTSGAAVGGAKIYVNNAGYGAPSTPGRDITDTDDGAVKITGIAQFTGFIDLQGRTNESGAAVQVFDQELKAGATQYAGAASAAGGAYTTAYIAPNLLTVGSTYWLLVDRPLYLPTTAVAASSYADSQTLTTRPTTALGTVVLLGGDATDDNLIDVLDASCIGSAYGQAPGVCNGTGSSDVNGDGSVNILDLSLMGGNYAVASSPWAP